MSDDGSDEIDLVPRKPRRRLRRANSLKDLEGLLLDAADTAHEPSRAARFRERARCLHELEETIRDAFFKLLLRDLFQPDDDPPRALIPRPRGDVFSIPASRTRVNGAFNRKKVLGASSPVKVDLPLSYPRGMTRTEALEYGREHRSPPVWIVSQHGSYWSKPIHPSKVDNHLRLNKLVQGYGRVTGTVMLVDRYPDDRRRKPESIDVDEIEFEIAELMCASPVIRAYIRSFWGDDTKVGQALKRVTETHGKLIDEIMALRRADPVFQAKVDDAGRRQWERNELVSPRLAQPRWQVPNDEPLAWRSEVLSTCTDLSMKIHKPRRRGEPKPFGEEVERDDLAHRQLPPESLAALGDDGCPIYDDYSDNSSA